MLCAVRGKGVSVRHITDSVWFPGTLVAQVSPAELQTAVLCNSSVPALAAHGPDGVGHLCLVCEPEMEISGSPVMAMCTRGIADENLLLVLVKSQKHLRKIWHAALEFA